MTTNKTIVLATRNPGKTREFQTLLAPLGYHVITAAQAGYDEEPDETGTTFRANAEIKARAVFEGTGGQYPVLSDDSGLAVDALGGAPGVYSARYAGPGCSDDDNNRKLAQTLAADPDLSQLSARTGRYQIALCLIQPQPVVEQKAPLLSSLVDASTGSATARAAVFFEGTCEGVIGFEERGSGGFGFDVLFIPTGADGNPLDGRTFAEMTAAEKHPLSHRGKAVAKLIDYLRNS
jgi:XTP/dITP diphosphohydrolase